MSQMFLFMDQEIEGRFQNLHNKELLIKTIEIEISSLAKHKGGILLQKYKKKI